MKKIHKQTLTPSEHFCLSPSIFVDISRRTVARQNYRSISGPMSIYYLLLSV